MRLNHFAHLGIIAILLVSCSVPPEQVDQGAIWDVQRCIDKGGLFVESQPPRCIVGENEYPMGLSNDEIKMEPGVEDWSDKSFFSELKQLGEPLDFVWDIDIPIIGQHGKTAVVDGEMVYFFRYASSEEANGERVSMEKEGTKSDGTAITWGEEVHYLQNGVLLAVYVGSNQDIVKLLEEAGE